MKSAIPLPIPGSPQAESGSFILPGKDNGVTHHSSSPCLPGHVLLAKTLIP